MFFLDTTTASQLMRGAPTVVATLATHRPHELRLPQPVVAEIEFGLSRLADSARRDRLRRRLALLCREIARAEWTDAVSHEFGLIKAELERAGSPVSDFDVAIAAHARPVGGVVVTDNVRHFERVAGLSVESWSRS